MSAEDPPAVETPVRLSQTVRIEIPPDLLSGIPEAAQVEEKSRRRDGSAKKPSAVSSALDFQQLFQSVYDGAIITDFEGKIVDANLRAVELLAHPRDALCRMNVVELMSGADGEILKTIRENLKNHRYALIKAYAAAKGRMFAAEISVNQLTLSKRSWLCFFVRDITRRKQAEEMLQTVHNAMQNSADGILILDFQLKIHYLNPTILKLWGIADPKEVMGREIRELGWSSADGVAHLIQTVASGRTWSGELIARRADGVEVSLQAAGAPNRNAEGELQGMVCSFIDISDRKRAEEAVRQGERQRVMLESIGAACHHLGQPATVLLAALTLIQKRARGAEGEFRDLLQTSLRAAESLGDILRELNATDEYRTQPYLENAQGDETEPSRIIDIQPSGISGQT